MERKYNNFSLVGDQKRNQKRESNRNQFMEASVHETYKSRPQIENEMKLNTHIFALLLFYVIE